MFKCWLFTKPKKPHRKWGLAYVWILFWLWHNGKRSSLELCALTWTETLVVFPGTCNDFKNLYILVLLTVVYHRQQVFWYFKQADQSSAAQRKGRCMAGYSFSKPVKEMNMNTNMWWQLDRKYLPNHSVINLTAEEEPKVAIYSVRILSLETLFWCTICDGGFFPPYCTLYVFLRDQYLWFFHSSCPDCFLIKLFHGSNN